MSKIRINQGRIIPSQFRMLFTALCMLGIIALTVRMNNPLGFLICLVLSLLIIIVWTSFSILEVDLAKRKYVTYNAIMGRAFQKEEHAFERIDCVKIVEANKSQTMHSRGGVGHTCRWKEYEAYLVLDQDKKVFLISDENQTELKERLKPILKKLDTEIKSS